MGYDPGRVNLDEGEGNLNKGSVHCKLGIERCTEQTREKKGSIQVNPVKGTMRRRRGGS